MKTIIDDKLTYLMEDQFQMILAHKFLNAFKPEDVAEFAVSTVILITIIIANLIIKN